MENKWFFLNVLASLTLCGSIFDSQGAVTAKAQLPSVPPFI